MITTLSLLAEPGYGFGKLAVSGHVSCFRTSVAKFAKICFRWTGLSSRRQKLVPLGKSPVVKLARVWFLWTLVLSAIIHLAPEPPNRRLSGQFF